MIIPYIKKIPTDIYLHMEDATWCCIRIRKAYGYGCHSGIIQIFPDDPPIVNMMNATGEYRIDYCPFCGEKIQTKRIEVKKIEG